MAESVASDFAIARLIQKLGGSTRRSVIADQIDTDGETLSGIPTEPPSADPESKTS